MKLLANENIPKFSVQQLRKFGYNVASIGDEKPGITDKEVMHIAQIEQRLIITFDRDYGELIYKHGFKPDQGVLYLRLSAYSTEEPANIVHDLLATFHLETEKRLTVYDG